MQRKPQRPPVQMREEQGTEEEQQAQRPPPLTHNPNSQEGGNPSLGQSLVKQENVRLSRALLYPTAQRPRSRVWLSVQKSALVQQTQDLVPGCRRGRGGQQGCLAAAAPHLFSIRICTLCTRSRASCRICFALCRSAISLKNLMMSVKSMLFSRMMSR